MPIKPPRLDDRKYDDIVREARSLIPQYCPEWTNLSDADPGITLVQLFAWMTEMTLYRLNRVPDKTYVHFLNFIGEERKVARPAAVPITFTLRSDQVPVAEIPAFTRCSTVVEGGQEALHFLTTDPVSVHGATIDRMVAVHAGEAPMVREIPFRQDEVNDQVLLFGGGQGVQLFKMDPVEHGPRAFTPFQYLYLAHDDFRLMGDVAADRAGRVRVRTASEENLPIASMFRWEYRTENGWRPVETEEEEEDVLGLPELSLKGVLKGIQGSNQFGNEGDEFTVPDQAGEEQHWLRGVMDYERWLAARMMEDLEITWRDDRGGEERQINNWDVRATGRNLEFFIQDMPPIRAGWTVRFTMVDRAVSAGRNAYFPQYRFSYRRGDSWEQVPMDRVRYQNTTIVLTGPFADMATDGYNLRAERIETVHMLGLVPNLDLELSWLRPIEISLAAGPESDASSSIEVHQLPKTPFQPATTLPPLLGMKFFVGSDVLENRAQRPVVLELEVSFEIEGKPIEEPLGAYSLQLTYRAADTWRVVHTDEGTFTSFAFADLDPEGALQERPRKIRINLDPKTQLKGLFRSIIAGRETTWLRLEITRASMTVQDDKRSAPRPVSLKIHTLKIGVDGSIGRDVYEQPMPGVRTATVEYRNENRRLSRAIVRSSGRLYEHFPFDHFIDIKDEGGPEDNLGHVALYMRLDKPLPVGQRHAMMFRCRGETFLPEGSVIQWEQLEEGSLGRVRWRRLVSSDDSDREPFLLNKSGVLEFPYYEAAPLPTEGNWVRALFRMPKGHAVPSLPPVSHLMLNSVDAVNLHEFRVEKFSGEGIPNQQVKLRRFPVFLHPEEGRSEFSHPDRFPDIRLFIVEEDGERREWRRAPGNSLLAASKDDRVFIVDAVEGLLTFGNGIRGRMVPVGSYNISVDIYHTVPGAVGNVGPRKVSGVEGFADMVSVTNVLPAAGGRNAETIEEIIRRAPSVLTSRDRAVTRLDFQVIAEEASAEVARAACDGAMSDDGVVEVVVLPHRRPGERVPDPFLATGLVDHVRRYLGRRCLVNVQPVVRLATFCEVDVSITVRLRPNSNFIQVREQAKGWVKKFLDPYDGGLDAQGWPFGGTLFAQDFGRMVRDLPEVRHIVEVHVYEVAGESRTPGWETGQGVSTLVLDRADLFVLRHVRVVSEEGSS